VAELLGVPGDCVGLKAKTPEGLNLDNAAIAHVAVLLKKAKPAANKKTVKKRK
jgi:2-C-methyl-D-erythritol 2,4-cyclodiphosphate synthase